MQQGQAAALWKTTWWSRWRSWTGASSAVFAANTSHILGCISKRVACRSENAILPFCSVVMRHLGYLFTMYNCQMGLFRKDGSRFFSEVHLNRNVIEWTGRHRQWEFQLDTKKTFFPSGWSGFSTDYCPERLWDLHKYSKLNWTSSLTSWSNSFCFQEEVVLETPRSSFHSTGFYDSLLVKLQTWQ